MKEREIITAFTDRFVGSLSQRNERFASDAEIVDIDGASWAITIDEFSAEDRLPTGDPTALGWNLAAATISDLLAVGAVPRFMLNSLVCAPFMDAPFLGALSAGMQEALTASGACMLGGDVGTGSAWRFTGIALGSFRAGQTPMSRLVSCAEGAVFASGVFGGANLAAAGAGPSPRFELRLAESSALAALGAGPHERGPAAAAAACIDTSDGLIGALEALCACDPGLRIELDPSAVAYAPGVSAAAVAMRVPREVFLMGSAGEYELVALVPGYAATAAGSAGMRRIGGFRRRLCERTSEPAAPGLFFRLGTDCVAHPGLPDPRDASSFDEYCACLAGLAQALFGAAGDTSSRADG